MNRQAIGQFCIFLVLVAVAAGLRIELSHIPNFAPVAGVALFAGFFFRSRLLAWSTPVAIMLISDAFLGAYNPRLMVAVYGMLMLPVAFSSITRKYFDPSKSTGVSEWAKVGGLVSSSLACSLAFFIVTNFVSWQTWYAGSSTSLLQSYVQALPFLRYTVCGDLAFASVLFGAYALSWAASRKSSLATA